MGREDTFRSIQHTQVSEDLQQHLPSNPAAVRADQDSMPSKAILGRLDQRRNLASLTADSSVQEIAEVRPQNILRKSPNSFLLEGRKHLSKKLSVDVGGAAVGALAGFSTIDTSSGGGNHPLL